MTAQLRDIQARIAKACQESGRMKDSVRLVAVTKNRSIDEIRPLLEAGHRIFGENRVQEAAEKWPALRQDYPDIQLHLIGHLQTNKAKEAVSLFDVIETIDSDRIATALSKEMDKQGKNLSCFIQVNTGEETQKDGVVPKDLKALVDFCKAETKINIRGLMCIPPAADIPDLHFALLKKLSAGLSLPELSMGMSSDFERAIRQGTGWIRVGTALFEPAA
jgi:pyridoxal phosphate enzyme (YggS family)